MADIEKGQGAPAHNNGVDVTGNETPASGQVWSPPRARQPSRIGNPGALYVILLQVAFAY